VVAAAVLAGLVPAAAGAQDGELDPRVLAAVQVTTNPDPSRAHSSPQIAVNPLTRELVIVEADVRNDKRCNVHISVDDGRSWARGGDPMLAPFTDCTLQATNGHYMSLQFDPRGVLFAAFLGSDPALSRTLNRSEVPRHVYLARSEDSGRTWQTTRAYEAQLGDPGIGGTRRPMVAVDPRDSQTIYIGWQKGGASGVKQAALVSISRDGGRTFGEPVDLSDEQGGTQPRVTVDGNGIVHAIFTKNTFFGVQAGPEGPPIRPLVYTRSTDRGATWAPVREIDPHNAGFSFGRKSLIVADRNSANLYVTWYGNTNPRARRPPAGQPSTDEFDDREIFVRVSEDGGETWSEARLVNDDADRRNIQHYDSGISVAPNGRVDIAWYDFRNSPVPESEESGGNGGGFQDVYYAYSTDGGRTFSPNVRVTDRLIDRRIGVWSNNVHSHTNVGIASTDDTVYVTWQDTRNGSPDFGAEDIYFAAIKLAADAGEDDEGVPGWIVFGAAAAVGAGLTILLVLGLARSRRAA
jgi:hypothetical protein